MTFEHDDFLPAKRLAALRSEHSRLLLALERAESVLAGLRQANERSHPDASARRQQVERLVAAGASRRRACALLEVPRSGCTARECTESQCVSDLRQRLVRLRELHPDFGIRRMRSLLIDSGIAAGKRRCEQAWREILAADNEPGRRHAGRGARHPGPFAYPVLAAREATNAGALVHCMQSWARQSVAE